MGRPYQPDNYLRKVIQQKKHIPVSLSDSRVKLLIQIVNEWGKDQIAAIKPSGSTAKGTAIKGSADLDVFISLKSSTTGTLGEIYNSLYNYLGKYTKSYSLKRRRQNVSVRVFYKDLEIDFVPGKKMPGSHVWHSLHVRRDEKTWTQTNVDYHISSVLKSGRVEEIILTKIWRDINKLDFPSFYLELVVMEALHGRNKGDVVNNFRLVLEYLSTKGSFKSKIIYDPANGSNKISGLLNKTEKNKISITANRSLKLLPEWKNIIY